MNRGDSKQLPMTCRVCAAILLVSMIGALFSAAIWFPANPIHVEPCQPACSNENAKAEGEESFWKWLTHDAITVYTLFLVAFNAILAVATVKLWKSTDTLVSGADDTAQRQLRAYVHVKSVTLGIPNSDGDTIIEVVLKNTGRTPAHDVIHWADTRFLDLPVSYTFPKILRRSTLNASNGILPPGGKIHKYIHRKELLIAYNETLIREGAKAIYVFGEVEYRDVFKKPHWTNYRVVSDHNIDIAGRAFACCDEGNEAD